MNQKQHFIVKYFSLLRLFVNVHTVCTVYDSRGSNYVSLIVMEPKIFYSYMIMGLFDSKIEKLTESHKCIIALYILLFTINQSLVILT